MYKLLFGKTLFLLGFGCVGQGFLPLLKRHFDLSRCRVIVLDANADCAVKLSTSNFQFVHFQLTRENYKDALGRYLRRGDFLLNLTVNVSSLDLILWCQLQGVDYLDTYIETWPDDAEISNSVPIDSAHALRSATLSKAKAHPWKSTALMGHGANPGLSFHFLKQALLNVATICGENVANINTRDQWADLAKKLDIRVIQVAEVDSQKMEQQKAENEFANTWSAHGLLGESRRLCEFSWGTHELSNPLRKDISLDITKRYGSLKIAGASGKIKSWTPATGRHEAFLISTIDAATISEFLRVFSDDEITYCPTVYYAYSPCEDAAISLEQLATNGLKTPEVMRVLKDELAHGADELGILLLSPRFGGYWFGSNLALSKARELATDNSATSLQVAAGVLSGMVWVLTHPNWGLIEPSTLQHEEILSVAAEYLGKVEGTLTNWLPTENRSGEKNANSDPLHFERFL
jgi:homospermidine synthase